MLMLVLLSEAVAQRRSVKKVFLEVSQNSHENTCARKKQLVKYLEVPKYYEHSCKFQK